MWHETTIMTKRVTVAVRLWSFQKAPFYLKIEGEEEELLICFVLFVPEYQSTKVKDTCAKIKSRCPHSVLPYPAYPSRVHPLIVWVIFFLSMCLCFFGGWYATNLAQAHCCQCLKRNTGCDSE